jgi:hypothetical protein
MNIKAIQNDDQLAANLPMQMPQEGHDIRRGDIGLRFWDGLRIDNSRRMRRGTKVASVRATAVISAEQTGRSKLA